MGPSPGPLSAWTEFRPCPLSLLLTTPSTWGESRRSSGVGSGLLRPGLVDPSARGGRAGLGCPRARQSPGATRVGPVCAGRWEPRASEARLPALLLLASRTARGGQPSAAQQPPAGSRHWARGSRHLGPGAESAGSPRSPPRPRPRRGRPSCPRAWGCGWVIGSDRAGAQRRRVWLSLCFPEPQMFRRLYKSQPACAPARPTARRGPAREGRPATADR